MTKKIIYGKTIATHLTELRDPLFGRDPESEKPWTRV